MNSSLFEKIYVPDRRSIADAIERTTHLAIGAHQDDLEIFAYHGIENCLDSEEHFFSGITVTNGSGSARMGKYQDYTDIQMQEVRHEEQKEAARIGRYSFQAQLGYPSSIVKDRSQSNGLVAELAELIEGASPEILYLHNPADKHDTHIAVLHRCLEAVLRVPTAKRPATIYGCEVWRDLDWLDDSEKVALPVGRLPELERKLIAVFDSQVMGGKDYVSAAIGRRRAHGTYFKSHEVDQAIGYTYALDLTPLIEDPLISLSEFVEGKIVTFMHDVAERIQRFG